MGNAVGVPRDFSALEQRRLEAIRLWKGGMSQAEATRRVQIVRLTVVRWVAQYRERGKAALLKAGRA